MDTLEIKQFRKKPVVIDAVRFATNNEAGDVNMNAIVAWIGTQGGIASHNGTDIAIETLEGRMTAQGGRLDHQGRRGRVLPDQGQHPRGELRGGGSMTPPRRGTGARG